MFSSIVVGTDGSDTAIQAVRQAVDMARAMGATLELVRSYAPGSEQRFRSKGPDASGDANPAMRVREEVEASLSDAAELARAAGVKVYSHAREGDPADVLLGVAEQQNADLLVVGNKGMTGARRLLGSVPNKVCHHAPCSVLIVRTS
jgi:nucleotide-binding universal stress UspA family protein